MRWRPEKVVVRINSLNGLEDVDDNIREHWSYDTSVPNY